MRVAIREERKISTVFSCGRSRFWHEAACSCVGVIQPNRGGGVVDHVRWRAYVRTCGAGVQAYRAPRDAWMDGWMDGSMVPGGTGRGSPDRATREELRQLDCNGDHTHARTHGHIRSLLLSVQSAQTDLSADYISAEPYGVRIYLHSCIT